MASAAVVIVVVVDVNRVSATLATPAATPVSARESGRKSAAVVGHAPASLRESRWAVWHVRGKTWIGWLRVTSTRCDTVAAIPGTEIVTVLLVAHRLASGLTVDAEKLSDTVLESAYQAGTHFTEHRGHNGSTDTEGSEADEAHREWVAENFFDGSESAFDDVTNAFPYASDDASKGSFDIAFEEFAGSAPDSPDYATDAACDSADCSSNSSDDSTHELVTSVKRVVCVLRLCALVNYSLFHSHALV